MSKGVYKRESLINKKYSFLTVISFAYSKNRQRYWDCRCDCGKIITTTTGHLSSGHTKSCGSCAKSKSKLGKKNPMWKGDDVGYNALHAWINRYLPKPKVCECCKKIPPYDLANKSGKYKRDLSDWEWLCRGCHMTKDGRMKIFVNSKRNIK
ncbi:hypothetical protein KAR28_04290 [Candidatus Parcubacteria bacterium]|nr:hypothetical protein [Candidatus Parcubacteria bacterium]